MRKRKCPESVAALGLALVTAACGHAGVAFPWAATASSGSPGSAAQVPQAAEVATANREYRRGSSRVLVRKVTNATRANLDYAAYHANFMNANPPPENAARAGVGKRPDPGSLANPFKGALEVGSMTSSFASLPLTAEERSHPLALDPLVELLTSKHVAGGEVLDDVLSKVRAEDWGLGGGPQVVRQTAVTGFVHQDKSEEKSEEKSEGKATPHAELWIQIEFAPWFDGFAGIPDADGDGHGELYGRIPRAALGADVNTLVAFIRDEYQGRTLSAPEVKGWAHQLASYWYPSFNTDLVTAGSEWPDADTEPEIVAELGKQLFATPTVVMRGKPQGQPVYNVFLVSSLTGEAGNMAGKTLDGRAPLSLPRSTPSSNPAPVVAAIKRELASHGSWSRWAGEVSPLHQLLKKKLHEIPAGAKATAGDDGFLFFGQSFNYLLGGDLEKQRRARNPVPVIVQFKKMLAEHGVDLLFVPVPTKEEIFPDKVAISTEERRIAAPFVGKVINPYQRKFLLELGEKGVEVVDLLPLFLAARAADVAGGAKTGQDATPLYQPQDTHWTSRGLELAARAVGERIQKYPWYKALAPRRTAYQTKLATFSRHGDLHSRLPEAEKARYKPETLTGHQVVTPDGTLYEDDADSPVVVLGDSFTGVFELMDCEHAGVSAHLARHIGHPVDLVMSYGGGPNVRQKLLRRGVSALDRKKVVVWMMTARDLFDFWEGWQPVTAK